MERLTEPDKRFNIYGVIHTIARVKTDSECDIFCVQLLNNVAMWFESGTAGTLIKGASIVQLITACRRFETKEAGFSYSIGQHIISSPKQYWCHAEWVQLALSL